MPVVTITILNVWTPPEKRALMDAVHAALVSAFGIPEHDRLQRIIELRPEEFDLPPGKGQRFVMVEIKAFAGRSPDAKRALYAALADGLEGLGVPRQDSIFIVTDPPLENWGLRGGQAACDVDIGFKLDV